MKFVDEYDYFVINDKVSDAVENIEAIITAERLKVKRHKNLLKKNQYSGGVTCIIHLLMSFQRLVTVGIH